MESPSLFQAVVRFPGALIRLPSAAVDTLDAINALAERIDRLVAQLERLEVGLQLAGTGVDVATTGIAQAVSGLQQAAGMIDSTLPPPFSSTASALRGLADRLGPGALQVVTGGDADLEHHADAETASPDLTPLVQLDVVVAEFARLLEAVVGSVPGVRQVFRITTTSTRFDDED